MIRIGQYEDALIEINNLDKDDSLASAILKSRILRKQSRYKDALSLAEKALEESRQKNDIIDQLHASIAVSKSYWGLGSHDEGLSIIDSSMILLNDLKDTPETKAITANLLDSKGLILYGKGELEPAYLSCEQGLKLRIELEDQYDIGNSLNSIGVIYANQGENRKALDYFERSLKIKETIGNKQEISFALNNVATIHYYLGNYEKSLSMNKKVLEINQSLGNKLDMASTLNNIGVDYHTIGNLDLALNHYEQSKELYEQIGNKQSIAMSINNIGGIYENQSKYEAALENYLQSLQIRKGIGNELEIADSLFTLISLCLEMNKNELAQECMTDLEKIKQRNDNKLIDLSYKLSKALILKKQIRAKDKLESHLLFEQIINDEILDYQMTIFAMFNLCELLIEELRSYGSEEVIDEIKTITDKLLNIAKEQNSYSILAETYLLQSKLELLVGDLELAKRLINQALFTAEEKGLMQLTMKISEEYDALLDRNDLWESLIEQGASVSERLEQLNLQDQMMRLIQKKWDKSIITPEEPITLMILSIGGLVLYSKTFSSGQINENLIGSFISAINSFSNEAFASRGSIERIKHQEYTIAMKRKEKITFCYIFKGQLFPAKQKLNKVVELITSSDKLWGDLNDFTPILADKSHEMINEITAKIFMQNS
ncbi:MAG: tetratricopeptide repeat protein [Candidatus Kariarchaeaceae archaeon]|jgi:tetratricopeptide (TPR) repeat protein